MILVFLKWKLRAPKAKGLFLVDVQYYWWYHVHTNLFICVENTLSHCSVGRIQAESRCPELLANYTDLLLRKTGLSKRLGSEDIDRKLNDVVSSFFNLIVFHLSYFAIYFCFRLVLLS